MIGLCPYNCSNKTEYGYCKTTGCINPKYQSLYFGVKNWCQDWRIQMVTSDEYTICQKKNQIIINLPQTWETLGDSAFPIVDRKPYLSTEQEMCLLAIVKELMRGEQSEVN